MKTQQQIANAIARKHGCGKASIIIIDPTISEGFVKEHIRFGYRKFTTGEYVPNKYRANFGWKNTYYQPAITTVVLPQ